MTDPNLPPREPERVVHHTTINTQPERRGGGGFLAFIIGGLVVAVAVIAFFVWRGGAPSPTAMPSEVNIDVDLPRPDLPQAPRLPEGPTLPSVNPPTVPSPSPAPAT